MIAGFDNQKCILPRKTTTNLLSRQSTSCVTTRVGMGKASAKVAPGADDNEPKSAHAARDAREAMLAK